MPLEPRGAFDKPQIGQRTADFNAQMLGQRDLAITVILQRALLKGLGFLLCLAPEIRRGSRGRGTLT